MPNQPHRAEVIAKGHPEYERIDLLARRLEELMTEFTDLRRERLCGALLGFVVEAVLGDPTITNPREAVRRAGEGMLALYDSRASRR